MAGAISSDAASAGTLHQAKAEALSSLRESMPGFSPLQGAHPAPSQPTAPGAQDPDLAALGAGVAGPPTDEAIQGNEGIIPGIPTAQDPTPKVVDKNTEDNGEVGFSSAMHFLRDTFKGTGEEAANALPRAAARLGGWLTNAAAGGVFLADMAVHKGEDKGRWADHVFDFKKKYVDSAVDYWTPKQAAATGEAEGTGGAAQAVGRGMEMIPGVVMGAPVMLAQVLQSSTDSALTDIDQGASIKKAIADGTVDGVATWISAKFGMRPGPSILRRVIGSIGAGDLIHMAGNVLKAGINKAFGDPNAPTPSIFEGLDEATVTNAIFGAFGGKGHTTLADKGQAPSGSGTAGAAPQPSNAALATATPKQTAAPVVPVPEGTSAKPAAPAPSSVPDKPSVEPQKDIKAQFKDMNDPLTPRTGVLITPDTATHLGTLGDKTTEQAKKQGRTVDLPQGTLVLKTKADVIKVNNRIKNGEDPQSVIGSVTGAGSGKSPDATAVVQGHDQNGAVVTETTVHPSDVPLAIQKVEDQGKTPVVTTPAEAISRRVAERNNEVQGTPLAPDAPVSPHVEKAAQPAAPEPVAKTEVAPEHESEGTPAAPEPRMGLFKSASGKEVAVHIEDGAPEGKLRVRPIDSSGEPAERTIDVPAASVRQSHQDESAAAPPVRAASEADTATREAATPSPSVENARANEQPAKGPEVPKEPVADSGETAAREQAPTVEVKPAAKAQAEETTARKPTSAMESLPAALAAHEKQEYKAPDRKNPDAGLTERQDNASAFAAVLHKAATESLANRAKREANTAENDDGVSPISPPEKAPASAGKKSLGQLLRENSGDKVRRALQGMSAVMHDIPPGTEERAIKAANAAIKLTLKSKEETAAGKGTSHTLINSLVDEMHRSARALMGKATEADIEPAVAPKAAALKRKIALKKEAAAKPAKEPAKKVETAADVIAKDAKRAGLSAKEQIRTNKLSQEVIHADFDEFPAAHEKMLKHLHALADEHGDSFPREQIDTYMRFLTEQHEEQHEGKRTGRMSDTLEEESSEFEQPEEGFSRTYRPQIEEGPGAKLRTEQARRRMSDEWNQLGQGLENDSFFHHMNGFRDTGEPLGAHFLMGKLLEQAKTPILRTLLTEIRSRIPDAPVYNRSEILNMRTGKAFGKEGGVGLATDSGGALTMQVNFDPTGRFSHSFMARTFVHEAIHSATMTELKANPHGELAQRMENARDVLARRLESKYGEDVIAAHEAYFRGGAPKPEGFMRHLYGISDVHEMMAEVMTNPDFIREIAESESFASPREALAQSKGGLLTRIFRAIGEFFGVKDAKLLQHIVDSTFEVMDANRSSRPELFNKRSQEFHSMLPPHVKAELAGRPLEERMVDHALSSIAEEAPPLRGVDKQLSTITEGSDGTQTAREFAHVFKSRSADRLRRGVIALKTVGQIYRDHFKDFGHDDGTNPLRAVQEADMEKNHRIAKLREISAPVAKKWQRLSKEDDMAVSQLMIDTTMYKLDPRSPFDQQTVVAKAGKGAEARHAEFVQRLNKLSPEAREVYSDATEANRKLIRAQRRAGVDTAIDALDASLTDAQRGLLYGAKTPKVYDSLIGKGKLIDIGENNDKLKAALSDFAGFTESDGPYHHLGRQGDYVVSAEPEGTREFDTKAAAEEFAKRVSDLSPNSSGKVVERGGKFAVDYKAQYVSMHESRHEAEQARDRMAAAGLDVGLVTQKTMNGETAPLTSGMKELVTEAERKIQKNGTDTGTEAMVASLRSAFLQMIAARSAYAGSRLARKNVGGVKAEDMRRNFAEHALSAGWHTAQMQTVFQRAEAMAKVRGMARDNMDEHASQGTMYRRGKVVEALNKHALNEVQSFGHKAPFNAMLAKLGFMNYLASPSHAIINMTQNFTTGIPVAGARWGYRKSVASFARSMAAVTSPTMKSTIKAVMSRGGTSEDIHNAVLAAIAKHPTFGKWASGSNSHVQQLIDRGVISHGYADELGRAAQGKSARIDRVFEWARLLPSMADSFNRISTALTGLELTGGDIRKTSDFVQEIHADYSAENKPLAFKRLSRLPGLSTITMFKTYPQEMAHLTYGNLIASFRGENKAEAAKTLAGLMVGNMLFAGVYGAIGLEPLRLAMYAWRKAWDDEGEVFDFKNSVHRFLVEHLGKDVGNVMAGGPIARLFGVDISRRMGMADLFFHDPPDMLSADKDEWKNFVFDQMGPMVQEAANNVTGFMGKMQRGDTFGAIASLVPVKAFNDAVKAVELLKTGKRDSIGGQMTEPSKADALRQFIGLKPASVADAQEKTGVRIEYAQAAKKTKDDIVKQFVSSDDKSLERAKAVGRMQRWNRNNPTVPITNKDIQRLFNAQARTNVDAPDRNEKAAEATDF